LLDMLRPIEPEALAGIPSAIMFMAILFGVLYEISQPIQSLNTDLVNWLPISPMEYVGGSTLSESYIYSFVLCLLLGPYWDQH
jgi:Fe2+ transport system protein B